MPGRTFVFGYGSLLNEAEVQRTLPGKTISGRAVLRGWRRKFSKSGLSHRYLSLVKAEGREIRGTLIEVTEEELALLEKREPGYKKVDVTVQLVSPPEDATVLAFIAPPFEELPIRQSYLERIRPGVPPEEWEAWLEETDFSGIKGEETSFLDAVIDTTG